MQRYSSPREVEKVILNPKNGPEYNWYVWYTKPRAEKKVRDRLLTKGIEVLLPLRKELRQWSDRKKWVESPLFNGYIFTYLSQREWDGVSFTEGMLTYVRCEGKPAVIRQNQIEQIKRLAGLADGYELVEDIDIQPGEIVEVVAGPFTGMQGEMISFKGNHKLAVRFEQLGQVLLVHLPLGYIKSLKRA